MVPSAASGPHHGAPVEQALFPQPDTQARCPTSPQGRARKGHWVQGWPVRLSVVGRVGLPLEAASSFPTLCTEMPLGSPCRMANFTRGQQENVGEPSLAPLRSPVCPRLLAVVLEKQCFTLPSSSRKVHLPLLIGCLAPRRPPAEQ